VSSGVSIPTSLTRLLSMTTVSPSITCVTSPRLSMRGEDDCEPEDFELVLTVATMPTNKRRKHARATNASLWDIFFLIFGTIQPSAQFWRKVVYKGKTTRLKSSKKG